MPKFLKTSCYIFCLLGILFIPFPFNVFPYQTAITDFIFGDVIAIVATDFLEKEQYYHVISSDSSSMYILAGLLFFFSGLLGVLLTKTKFWQTNSTRIFSFSHTLFCYYVALQLLNYGVDKVFKSQFYLPEPNILYTPFGQLDKDILFWSTMGTSYAYNLFIGTVQLLAGAFILIRRIRTLGLLLSLGVFLNIIAINFSYDISVKLYTSFLFVLTLVAIAPQLSQLFDFFVLNKTVNLQSKTASFSFIKYRKVQPYLKILVIFLIVLEVLIPYIKSGNFNDDLVGRPYLHGAYKVEEARSQDSVKTLSEIPIERVFIHRKGYLVFQDHEDNMADFKLKISQPKGQFLLTDYSLNQRQLNYNYSPTDSILNLQYFYQGDEYVLRLKALDWQSLPVLQNRFHWVIDGY